MGIIANVMLTKLQNRKKAQQQARIRLGHDLVDNFFERHARCCMCGKDFLCSQMVHFSISSRYNNRKFNLKCLPDDYLMDTYAVKAYYEARTYENLFKEKKFLRTSYVTSDEWLASHNEKRIFEKKELLKYPTLYFHVPQYISKVNPPAAPGKDIWKQVTYEWEQENYRLYMSQCKNYIVRNLPFRKKNRFYCIACANKRYQKAQELVQSFQSLYPTLKSIAEVESKKIIEQAGEEGERLVEYELGWLSSEFISVRKDFPQKLFIANPNFRNGEKQEYDHLLVSPYGVFSIETKNWGGCILIDESGQWIQLKSNQRTGLSSPCSQLERHYLLLRSILSQDIPIFNIICIGNKNAVIDGAHYSEFPVIKYDRIRSFIKECSESSESHLPQEKVSEIVALIEKYTVKS